MISPSDRKRYGRQIRLSEIGEAGQARLCAAAVRPSAVGFARTIEERYLRAAGLRLAPTSAEATNADADVDASTLGLRHAAAREIGDGALRALKAIRSALASGPAEPRS
jgi:hypothetical protein